ncbi:hypothetical protein WDU94_007411, partial [Cyamophila willieti]
VVPKLGSADPQGAVKDFQGPRRPGQKKIIILRHNLLKSHHWCFKLKKHDFQTTFEIFYTLIFQKRGLRRFRRVSRTTSKNCLLYKGLLIDFDRLSRHFKLWTFKKVACGAVSGYLPIYPSSHIGRNAEFLFLLMGGGGSDIGAVEKKVWEPLV